MGKFCCCIDFFVCSIQLTITDVVTDRSGKQMCVLKNDTERMSQVIFFDLCDIDSIITDLSILDIVETVEIQNRLRNADVSMPTCPFSPCTL